MEILLYGGNLMMSKRWAVLLVCLVFGTAAFAEDIYRWVDEKGRVSISDNVPARYRDVATKIDASASNISERQRQQALERADRERQAWMLPKLHRRKPHQSKPVS